MSLAKQQQHDCLCEPEVEGRWKGVACPRCEGRDRVAGLPHTINHMYGSCSCIIVMYYGMSALISALTESDVHL